MWIVLLQTTAGGGRHTRPTVGYVVPRKVAMISRESTTRLTDAFPGLFVKKVAGGPQNGASAAGTVHPSGVAESRTMAGLHEPPAVGPSGRGRPATDVPKVDCGSEHVRDFNLSTES